MGIIPETATLFRPMTRSASSPIDHDDLSVVDLVVDRGRSTVLEIDALRIPHGYTALVGPNGSGKTTLLHVFAGLIEPRAGTIEFGMCAPGTDSTRLAYVLQSQQASEHLLVTAREVVALARVGASRRVRPTRPHRPGRDRRRTRTPRDRAPRQSSPRRDVGWSAAAGLHRPGARPGCRGVAARRAGGRARPRVVADDPSGDRRRVCRRSHRGRRDARPRGGATRRLRRDVGRSGGRRRRAV